MRTPLPTGWNEGPLGSICTVVSGATPKTNVESYWGGEFEWLTPADMSRDRSKVVHAGTRSITAEGLASCGATLFPAGSVVISSRAPIGYVAIAGKEMCTSQGCKTAVPPDYLDSSYLYWFLIAARSDLQARASGTTFKELSGKRFAETVLRWPELPAQRRIVDVLEDHLSRLEYGRAALQVADVRLSSLLSSWLSAAMTNDERETVTVGDTLEDVRGGWSRSSAHLVEASDGVPYVKMNNLTRSGRLDLSSLVHVQASDADKLRFGIRAGDVLFNSKNSGDLVGKTAVADRRVDGAVLNENIMRLRFRSDIDSEFAALWFRGPLMRRNILGAASASTNVAAVYQKDLLKFPMWVPGLALQRRLVREYNAIVDRADLMRTSLAGAKQRGSALRAALLAAAFSGRLTGAASDHDRVEELAEA